MSLCDWSSDVCSSDLKITRKKDDQLLGAGSAKGSGISGRDQRYTAFIHISDLFQRYIFDLFLICRYFLPVLLLIPDRLFFLVILCRRNASRMPLSLHPNASAISDWYASGWAATYAFSFSGSIFRKLLRRSFFSKFPVSFSCFSHFCIVDLETLKT